MPKSRMNSNNEGPGEEIPQTPRTAQKQPKHGDIHKQELIADMTSQGDRILGLTKEHSGWDVYNNEARKVDTELVKDWTTSLNFLLIFVSLGPTEPPKLISLSHYIGRHLCGSPDCTHCRKQEDARAGPAEHDGRRDDILHQ
jgi:hypothetical protein